MKQRIYCIIYNEKYGYLVMLKYKKNKGVYHQLLTGKLETGETYLQGIQREVKEEINIIIDEIRFKELLINPFGKYYYLRLLDEEINNIQISNEHVGYTFVKKQYLLPLILVKSTQDVPHNVQLIIDKNMI